MSEKFSRRAFLKQAGLGLVSTLAVVTSPLKNRLQAFGLIPVGFEEVISKMPQFELQAPESIVDNQKIFKIPRRAISLIVWSKVGGIVAIRRYKGQLRLHSVGVTIDKMDYTWAYIKEKPNTVLPVYHLNEGTIILDDLRDTLIRLREIDAAELRARFIKVGEEG